MVNVKMTLFKALMYKSRKATDKIVANFVFRFVCLHVCLLTKFDEYDEKNSAMRQWISLIDKL